MSYAMRGVFLRAASLSKFLSNHHEDVMGYIYISNQEGKDWGIQPTIGEIWDI
jgi:hypothetical protein